MKQCPRRTPPASAVTNTSPGADGSGYTRPEAPFGKGHTSDTLRSIEEHDGRVFISPIARHIASEHNLDISQIQGTGPGGRIIRSDVETILRRPAAGQQEVTVSSTVAPGKPDPGSAAHPDAQDDRQTAPTEHAVGASLLCHYDD